MYQEVIAIPEVSYLACIVRHTEAEWSQRAFLGTILQAFFESHFDIHFTVVFVVDFQDTHFVGHLVDVLVLDDAPTDVQPLESGGPPQPGEVCVVVSARVQQVSLRYLTVWWVEWSPPSMGFIHNVISPVVVAVGFTSSSLNTELIFLSKSFFFRS